MTTDLVPIVLGALGYGLLVLAFRHWPRFESSPIIPPGDIIGPIERTVEGLSDALLVRDRLLHQRLIPTIASHWYRLYSETDPDDRFLRAEFALTRWTVGFFLALLIGFAIFGIFFLAVR
ncbi:MAG: hypothetical protein GEU90_06575 [Gemmatimonas sp.]|nr:hypothetical protein [Gemmatimonas sp.]